MINGNIGRDPATGQLKRDPTTGQLIRGTTDKCCCTGGGPGACTARWNLDGTAVCTASSVGRSGRFCVVDVGNGPSIPPPTAPGTGITSYGESVGAIKITTAGTILFTANAAVTNKCLVINGFSIIACLNPGTSTTLTLAVGDVIHLTSGVDCFTPASWGTVASDCIGFCCAFTGYVDQTLTFDASGVTGTPATGDPAVSGRPLGPGALLSQFGNAWQLSADGATGWGFLNVGDPIPLGYGDIGGKQVVIAGPAFDTIACVDTIWIYSVVGGKAADLVGRFTSTGGISDLSGDYVDDGTGSIFGTIPVSV